MKEYFLTFRYKVLLPTIQIAIYLGLLFLFLSSLPFNVFCLTLFLVMGVIFNLVRTIYWLKNASLTIKSKTVKYKNAGIFIETSWDMIENIEEIFLRSFVTKQDCLLSIIQKPRYPQLPLHGDWHQN